ncbi:MAG: C45 family autoproteolytic acyltransferase/hydrolase [Rikenellaceae bacterium]
MKRLIKIILIAVSTIIIVLTTIIAGLYLSADMMEPDLKVCASDYKTEMIQDTLYCNDSYLYRNKYDTWEMCIKGSRQERGVKQGALTNDLMRYQEDVFIEQINRIIPSNSYLKFLRVFLIIFNRNIAEHIDLEYREEIAAMSLFCTDEYNDIGTPYERQLNYHAAHDIGHTMQQYMLVGCSSFATWGERSCDGEVLVGRNFDFYVGDDFAKNKIITFASPDEGYRYASVGWAGMVGVLSGINEKGLTVTINAATGTIPISAKTPISILTREILQYASTIEEAYKIASKRETFVNESILVASQKDGSAAIIEKTPDETAIFYSNEEQILCTNHYQSDDLKDTDYNIENIATSDSKYRYDRLQELLSHYPQINAESASKILRDRYGKGGEDIGIGNEMTINQSIAHHSVIFAPASHLMWVSTTSWQSGTMACYDLSGFFEGTSNPTIIEEKSIATDTLFINNDQPRLLRYREYISMINGGTKLSESQIAEFLEQNPNHYYTYRLLGDYYRKQKQPEVAKEFYRKSLDCSIPYNTERTEISKIIESL